MANNQSPLRASLAWCKEENDGIEAKKAGISNIDPNDFPSIAYRIKHEAIKGIPRESKGHMVRLSKFEDHFERDKCGAILGIIGASCEVVIGVLVWESPSSRLIKRVAHSCKRESCVAIKNAFPRVRKAEI
tara:strand:+ start:1282 stop:1674 length:393 start_codon:yes stop_codon:yes gene_type:complete